MNYCDCGKEISRQALRCRSCAQKKSWVDHRRKKVSSLRKWHKENPMSEKTKEKLSLLNSGENNPNYIDGSSLKKRKVTVDIRKHKKWAKSVKERDGGDCQLCGEKGENVHHIDYDPNNFDLDNGVCLCVSCHSKTNFNREYWEKHFNYIKEVEKMGFGNYKISFKGRKETLEQVFGSKGLKPGEMIKKLWAFIKGQKLSNKK